MTRPNHKNTAQPFKDKNFSLLFYRLMVRSRVLEERLIKMAKSDDGFFWIGGPGEEAYSCALGLLVNRGEGPSHDYLHLHYRNSGVLLAMGAAMLDYVRQMKCSSLDPYSGGRNFVSHVAVKKWNILPVTSTIETQFVVAPGTAMAQRHLRDRNESSGITIASGGDAGTAEGDFASSLIWSSRPGRELPLLLIITNNRYGISTSAETQHGERRISDRAKSFQIETNVVDGNHYEKVWGALSDAMDYVRSTGRPFCLELLVSRLYGHSSSSGANRIDEACPIDLFEKRLLKLAWLSAGDIEQIKAEALQEANDALEIARKETYPDPVTVLDHSYTDIKGGLPGRDF